MSDSEFVQHGPCDKCGSSDANALYTDGHWFCWACQAYTPPDGEAPKQKTGVRVTGLIPRGEATALNKRHLSQETCRRYDYTVSRMGDTPVQVANYHDPITGETVAQKIRTADKDFKFLGDPKRAGLFGQHLCRDGGKRIIITEGEIDAMSVAQALRHKWQVVSLPNGAQSARKSLAKQIEFLNKFEQVVLCFDNDEPGREAVADCATLFPPGKLFVARLTEKDANAMLQKGRVEELVQSLWDAAAYRPDGIVTLKDLRERVLTAPTWGTSWFLPKLTELTYGRRLGECVALGAGTGVGKSDFLAEQIAFDLFEQKLPVAAFMLEQQPDETVKRVAGKVASRRFHVPDDGWTQAELEQTLDKMIETGRLYLYDHFGSADWEIIRERIRFLAHSEGVQHFYLDHLTALAAGDQEEERVALERIMAEIGGLVKELNIWLCFVSHLSTPEGKPHEEGGRVMIRHFKGSRAIGFWSHEMFGLERNTQADDADERTITTFRILKGRLSGDGTGDTFAIGYDRDSGRMSEREKPTGFGDISGADAPF